MGSICQAQRVWKEEVPVVQIENNHYAARGFFVFHLPFASKLATVSEKQKPPVGGGCFLLDRGAYKTLNQ